MARPIEFDENRVIEDAMQALWSRGVHAMTVTELLQATGLARSSFYNSYGSKDALVLKALGRYSELDRATLAKALAAPSLADVLQALFVNAIDNNHGGRGCLLLNAAGDASAAKSAVAKAVRDGIRRKIEQIAERIRQAQHDGEVDAAADPVVLATAVCTTIAGLRTFARARLPKAQLHAAAGRIAAALLAGDGAAPTSERH